VSKDVATMVRAAHRTRTLIASQLYVLVLLNLIGFTLAFNYAVWKLGVYRVRATPSAVPHSPAADSCISRNGPRR
jgi:hypothetical protein